MHYEPVKLSLGQRKSAGGFDRILSGKHNKRFTKCICPAVYRYLTLLHGFKQSRLGTRSCPVYLISQKNVCKYRSPHEFKLRFAPVVDIKSRYIGGEKVRCKLYPRKITLYGCSYQLCHKCLPGTGCIFDEYMSSGYYACQRKPYDILLAYQYTVYVFFDP